MAVEIYWTLFFLVGLAAVVAAKRLDDRERERWAEEERPSTLRT